MTPNRPDPGGNFESDVHRRVMAALANPDEDRTDMEEIMLRVSRDPYIDLELQEDVVDILEDLEADGDADRDEDGWRNTKAGFDALSGPTASDGGRAHE